MHKNYLFRFTTKTEHIRRVNVNIAATTVENYRKLKGCRHRNVHPVSGNISIKKSYLELHPTGPKHDYDYHTEAMDQSNGRRH